MQTLTEPYEGERLSTLLKQCRLRISVNGVSLGDFSRLPSRIGKRVTQEEIAEAASITRQWYAKIENGAMMRISPSVLSRIADALMMTPSERAALFEIALPELGSAAQVQHANDVFHAVGSVQRFTRRLWAASSELEALEVVSEFAMTELFADVIVTHTRIAPGRWTLAGTGKRYDFDLFTKAEAAVVERWGDAAIDDLLCFNKRILPAEVLTMCERDERFPSLAMKRRPALEVLGWPHLSSAMASIETDTGFVARLCLAHTSAHVYSQLEREQLATLAELASLALAGCVK